MLATSEDRPPPLAPQGAVRIKQGPGCSPGSRCAAAADRMLAMLQKRLTKTDHRDNLKKEQRTFLTYALQHRDAVSAESMHRLQHDKVLENLRAAANVAVPVSDHESIITFLHTVNSLDAPVYTLRAPCLWSCGQHSAAQPEQLRGKGCSEALLQTQTFGCQKCMMAAGRTAQHCCPMCLATQKLLFDNQNLRQGESLRWSMALPPHTLLRNLELVPSSLTCCRRQAHPVERGLLLLQGANVARFAADMAAMDHQEMDADHRLLRTVCFDRDAPDYLTDRQVSSQTGQLVCNWAWAWFCSVWRSTSTAQFVI